MFFQLRLVLTDVALVMLELVGLGNYSIMWRLAGAPSGFFLGCMGGASTSPPTPSCAVANRRPADEEIGTKGIFADVFIKA